MPANRTDAQIRASAQRKLAKELKAGTFKKSNIGAKAREAANKLVKEKDELIKRIIEYKDRIYGAKGTYNKTRSDKNVRINPNTNKPRTVEQLRTIAETLDQIEQAGNEEDFYWEWQELFGDDDYESAFYYK